MSKDSKDLLGHYRTCSLSFEDVQGTSLWGMVPIEFHLPLDERKKCPRKRCPAIDMKK